ncbi:MAG: acetyl-CoA decarbonylase/synthase complex subunit gamma [Dehalococcoidia bacterium]|nr:MAG: acetyl-CoA decarbonylase/synthase complex subunit gamma [Dehalococcoidia bacterium]
MPLSGIEIFKLLPKTNCGKCGVPTCLAFAMSLAAGKAELAACPFVTAEAKTKLEEASAPPIRPIVIGSGERMLKVGGETVLFRHEKRFENPPGLAILISDNMEDAEVGARLKRFKELSYVRVGLKLRPELIALRCDSNDAAKFTALVSRVKAGSDGGIILMTLNPDVMASALKVCAERKPLLYAANMDNADKMANLAKEAGCPLVAKSSGLDELAALTEKLTQLGVKDIVIDSGARKIKQALQDQVMIRRLALNKKFRPLGFPTIILANEMTNDPMQEALVAATFIAKYGGIIVLSDFQGETLFPLLVLRMNLYSDPQRPLATTEGIYDIGGPGENSPVLVTSNFSLTYFIVSGEIENSRVPTYLIVKDTEGLSVMTAWAAGKFAADNIAALVKKSGIADKVKHRKIVIPGYIASESGGLEEELPGWQVLVGPREGAHIPPYLKNWKV